MPPRSSGDRQPFTPGATAAWITEKIGEDQVRHVFTVEQQTSLAAAFAGTICAGALTLIDLRLPILLADAGLIGLAIGLAFCLPERNFSPALRTGDACLAILAAPEVLGIVAVALAPALWVALAAVWLKGALGRREDRWPQVRW